jgi:predicted dehydrogenase
MTLSVALVGCGGMGRRHILGMNKLHAVGRMTFDLAAVCDVFPESAARLAGLAEELVGHRPDEYHDFSVMVRDAKPDAIIITTTPETHTDIGLEALAAGIHVMAEKPITLTVAQGRQLVDAAKAAGRKLAVAENYRRDPINRLGKALLDSGAIGKPFLAVQANSSSGEFVIITPWRHRKDRGGIVVDMGVHYTDILEFYMGRLADVFAMNATVDVQRIDKDGNAHPADAEDLSVGVARFQNGALANWMLSMAGRGDSYFHRAIYGTGGSLLIPEDRSGKPLRLTQRRDGRDMAVEDLLALVPNFALDDVTAALFGGERLATYSLAWADIDANLLGVEQADFVDAITKNREPEVTGEQGLRSLAAVYGFLESELVGHPVSVDDMLNGSTTIYEAQLAGAR